MSLVIQVKDGTAINATINTKSGSFEVTRQEAWLELPNGERRKIEIRLSRGEKPYAVGVYTISEESFEVGQYGQLQIKQLRLRPAQVAQRTAA